MLRSQLRIAIASLRMNRMRSALTTLGIIIGVASITLVLSLGEGARQSVTRQVRDLDNNVVLVKPGQNGYRSLSAYNPYNTAITTTLTERDLDSVKAIDNVGAVAPVMFLSGSIKANDAKSNNSPIIATSENLLDILGLKIRSGDFIDSATVRDTAAIGQQLAIELFGTDQAMGQSITIKGRPHTVVGIVKNTNTPINLSGVDLDQAVYVSLDDGKSFSQGVAQIQQLTVQLKDTSKLRPTITAIDKAILKNHYNERDFTVLGGEAIAKSSDSFFLSIVIVTSLVALITLIVGGIGIMNIMLVGVTERTREIGIRKALGATDRTILFQFLIESLVMCVVGGLIGLFGAYALAFLIGSQLSFEPVVNPVIISAAFGLALFIGLLFGLYPALKAAKKDPIEALRQYQ